MKETHGREEIIQQLTDTFRTHGYDGASLSEISEATGLGKSSLYHYFPGGKEEMGRSVVEFAREWLRGWAERSRRKDLSALQRLRQMLAELDDFYEGGRRLCVLGNLTVSGGHLFQEQLSETFQVWTDAFAELAAESGWAAKEARKRAEDAVAGIQGALIVAAALEDKRPFRRLMRRLPVELLKTEAEK